MNAIYEQVEKYFTPTTPAPGFRADVDGIKLALFHGVTKTSLESSLTQSSGSTVIVGFDFQDGEASITNLAPENCYEGCADSITIDSVMTAEPFVFSGDGMTLTIDRGVDIGYMLTAEQIEELEEEVMESLEAA